MIQFRRADHSNPALALFCVALIVTAPSPREAALAFALRLLARRVAAKA
jgi:hypothetical protein